MPLKLTSNVTDNTVENLGKVILDGEKITIFTSSNCKVTLQRQNKKSVLLSHKNVNSQISGKALLDDTYILERGFEKLVVKVEEQKEFKPPEIFVQSDNFTQMNDKKRKTTLYLGLILLTLLISSVVLGVKQKRSDEIGKKGESILSSAEEKYKKAISDSTYKVEARDLFLEIKKDIEELKSIGYKSDKLSELEQNVQKNEANILGESKVEIHEFLDLTLQISGFKGTNMVSSGEDIFVFDKENKNVIKVNIKTKNAKIVAKQDIVNGTLNIASYGEKLFLNKDDGIYVVDNNIKKVIERDWNDTELLYFYAGNMYLVDKDDNQIYRFSGNNLNFSGKAQWLAPGVEMDFSKTKDMTIDGSIWLISETGKVTKLTNGNPQQISLNGIADQIVKPSSIYTNEEDNSVYVLEKDASRVVALKKSGEFNIQYVNENLNQTTDLVVNETEGKVILLNDGKLNYFVI